jgi:uncharacterized protein
MSKAEKHAGQEAGRSRGANRLIHETSPYLLQHAHNPVEWYPWGREALERAKREDKPIFLSIGYSTCYWCHAMERECFEAIDAAEILNEGFISIKVDREERPDIDEQYMLAAQLITGRGGWPNSVWLTPDGRPWMAGAYFPRDQFIQILKRLGELWKNQRPVVEEQADNVTESIRKAGTSTTPQTESVDQTLVDAAVGQLREAYDGVNGGFQAAPKFPPHGSLRLLIHEYRRSGDKTLLEMIVRTLNGMSRGGIRDHVGGGFHRYAVDDRWFVPHFEKMLCDNAQLMRAYADGYLLTGDQNYRDVVEDIFQWLGAEMTDSGGAFYTAIDAGAVDEEGKFYVWDFDEISAVLGETDGGEFAEAYGLEKGGNYTEQRTGERPGTNILYLAKPIEEFAKEKGRDPLQLGGKLKAQRQKLLAVRNQRPSPHRDDKILAGWNGLMIESLAYAGRTLKESRYTRAAQRAADFILKKMRTDNGRVLRTCRAGQAKVAGYLDDFAFLAAGLLELYHADRETRWFDQARQLAEAMLEDFEDKAMGGFFYSSEKHDNILLRSRNLLGGGNIPSANGISAIFLLRLGELTGDYRYRQAARRTVESQAGLMRQWPTQTETFILATAEYLESAAPPKAK